MTASLVAGPCARIRRLNTLAQRHAAAPRGDADEDAERLLSFADPKEGGAGKEEEWVETHAGRSAAHDANTHVGVIDDIPDVDDGEVTTAMGGMNISGSKGDMIPDMDDIPDMEEDLEEGDDDATAAPKAAAPSSGGGDNR